MATVAGALTLGSCNKDDDDPAPAPDPVPVDTTPAPIIYPDEFYIRLNKEKADTLNSGDTIKANTLLDSVGANSDAISVDVIIRNGEKIDANSLSFSLNNEFLSRVPVSGVEKITDDSIYSITFPAIEGSYTLNINDLTRRFTVVSSKKASSNRSLTNKYSFKFDETNASFVGVKFIAYNEETFSMAHLNATGSLFALSDEDYNKYMTSALTIIKGDLSDKEDEGENKNNLSLKELKHFAYVANNIVYVFNIIGEASENSSELSVEVSY